MGRKKLICKATAVISSVIYGKDNADDDKTGQ